MKKLGLVIMLTIFSSKAFAHQINIELGKTKTSHNYFQLPNNDSNEVNLPDDKYDNSYRVKAIIDLADDKFLYLLYAPFASEYNFTSNQSFQFDNTNFSSNQQTKVSYKFNSYRVGYFKKFNHSAKFQYWLGGVLKIRDAKIKVNQAGASDEYKNIGVVPLIGLGAQYFVSDKISLFSHIDTLGFGQGYAYDFNGEVQYHFDKKNALGIGYRTFGGGVDNDTLMNFARFESYYVSYLRDF